MASRIEVSFNPHGVAEPWPQFLAVIGDPADVERLYKLGAEGWRLTFEAGGPGGFAAGSAPVPEEVENRLWLGAEAITENPDAEAMTSFDNGHSWKPWDPDDRL